MPIPDDDDATIIRHHHNDSTEVGHVDGTAANFAIIFAATSLSS